MNRGYFSIAYVVTGRAPTGEILRSKVWAAWWTGEPAVKPWRTPDAFGDIPRDGPGCGLHGINYDAERQALTAADEATRAAIGRHLATVQIDDAWARAAWRESLGKPTRYQPSRTQCRSDTRGIGSKRPWTTPVVDYLAAFYREVQPSVGVLGLVPPYTEADVQRAYRRIIGRDRLHPDHGGDAARFREVTEARDRALLVAIG